MVKYFLSALTAGLLATASIAQSIGPSTLNAAGGSQTIGGNTYEWSFAEMTVVSTAIAPGLEVTQGVLQSDPSIDFGVEESLLANVLVYPNPTKESAWLSPGFSTGGTLHITLLDASGKTLMKREVILSAGNEPQEIRVKEYPAGIYFLQVTFTHHQQTASGVYKIQKI